MSNLRVFFVGGLLSYRALFNWLTPWILIPTYLLAPIFQILLFAYIGRSAHLQSDQFYLVGNALQYTALPCLFAMANTIGGERWTQTLGVILVSPASRLALFLGRSLPVILNGALVGAFAYIAGSLILHVHIRLGAVLPIALVIVVTAVACTGLGLINAALGLRVRETAVLSNIFFGLLLVFCGVNVPLSELPGWMATIGRSLPLTHGIEAARHLADGASLGSVAGLVGTEAAIGVAYAAVGYVLLRVFEFESRRRATLETA
ncbi:MAG: ABC transporter permease [Gaiellaceae bacterium]